MKRVLMPLPSCDFDPTETGAPWQVLQADPEVEVVFATPDGEPGEADSLMLGRGNVDLGPLNSLLIADANGRAAYDQMAASPAFQHPIRYADIDPADFHGLVLPGGHAPGMKEYLESAQLRGKVVPFFTARKPIGAICHGVVLAARCRRDGTSVLDGYRTTALTEQMEMLAWILTEKWVGDYYRTYPETVQREVTRAMGPNGQFLPEPRGLNPARPSDFAGLIRATWLLDLCQRSFLRDSPGDERPAYTVVHDGHYVSARWPGDAFTFGRRFLERLRAAPIDSGPD